MPLYEYLCLDCGNLTELLVTRADDAASCDHCSSSNLKKMISAHSTFSSVSGNSLPGAGDTACCGSEPSQAGCAGPGSCCGKTFH